MNVVELDNLSINIIDIIAIENPIIEQECPICFCVGQSMVSMPCCNNEICPICYEQWHSKRREPECVFCRFADASYINIEQPENQETNISNPSWSIMYTRYINKHKYVIFILSCVLVYPVVTVVLAQYEN